MNNAEIVREFFRVEYIGSVRKISVCQISWDGPHKPVSTWEVAHEAKAASQIADAEATSQILNDERYFEICTECERTPCGWMTVTVDHVRSETTERFIESPRRTLQSLAS